MEIIFHDKCPKDTVKKYITGACLLNEENH